MAIFSSCIYKCNNDITMDTALKCDSCNRPFHAPCAGISRNEEIQLKAPKRKIIFHCIECDKPGNKMDIQIITNLLESKLNEIKLEIAALKQSTLGNESKCLLMEDVISEIEERKKRSNNIMIFKLPELATQNRQESEEHDENAVNDILSQIQIAHIDPGTQGNRMSQTSSANNSNPICLRTFRIGKPTNSQPRPLKVVLNNESAVLNVLRNKNPVCNQLKISISRDNTPSQQQALKEIRETLEKRKEEGEADITIRYINGSPKIVKDIQKNSPRNHQNSPI